jgi:hypothetical protein
LTPPSKRCIEIFQRLGYGRDKVKLVLNRFVPNKSVVVDKFEKSFEYPIFWRIPNDYASVSNSINSGVPLIESAPQSPVTVNLREVNSYRIYFLGKLGRPGIQASKSELTLLQGLSLAGARGKADTKSSRALQHSLA